MSAVDSRSSRSVLIARWEM